MYNFNEEQMGLLRVLCVDANGSRTALARISRTSQSSSIQFMAFGRASIPKCPSQTSHDSSLQG